MCKKFNNIVALIMAIAFCVSVGFAENSFQTGIEQMTQLERLPLLRPDVQVHYVGSIDKLGYNTDCNWWLYEDVLTKEWVIMEAQGPGCLWNFVEHHSVGYSDPVYRFYFDGSATPGFEIKHSEFGSKPPFIAPLADKFLPKVGRDPRLEKINFQIVRSFCPMPFAKSLKITSSIRLQDAELGGGWGHAIWHSYPATDKIRTFNGKENYSKLLDLWDRCGEDPKPTKGNVEKDFSVTIPGKSVQTMFEHEGEGSLASIRLQVDPVNKEVLGRIWIRIFWDGESTPAVECPIGAFFGNEYGYHRIQTLMQGTDKDGKMYCYWPMPFWGSAKIELENRGMPESSVKVLGTVVFKPASALSYNKTNTGHFRASTYQPTTPKEDGRDSFIATLRGSGHVVAGLISAQKSFCEGDVRVHIDGRGTPSVQSDGSESWACYGWGFDFPSQANPASSYDGIDGGEWSMLRLLMGDFYTFRTSLRMTVEGGRGDESSLPGESRSGVLFWYGEYEPAMVLTDFIDIGSPESEKEHKYIASKSNQWSLESALEGEFDHVKITDTGRTLSGPSEFVVTIAPENKGVILRRRSDQLSIGQHACVYVNGKKVKERNWHYADGNPNFRWLEDDFFIPASYTKGKGQIQVRIVPVGTEEKMNWNESFYWVFSLGASPSKSQLIDVALPRKALPPFETE